MGILKIWRFVQWKVTVLLSKDSARNHLPLKKLGGFFSAKEKNHKTTTKMPIWGKLEHSSKKVLNLS